jgi:hypothetical protein
MAPKKGGFLGFLRALNGMLKAFTPKKKAKNPYKSTQRKGKGRKY